MTEPPTAEQRSCPGGVCRYCHNLGCAVCNHCANLIECPCTMTGIGEQMAAETAVFFFTNHPDVDP